jgi:hypothetical protein
MVESESIPSQRGVILLKLLKDPRKMSFILKFLKQHITPNNRMNQISTTVLVLLFDLGEVFDNAELISRVVTEEKRGRYNITKKREINFPMHVHTWVKQAFTNQMVYYGKCILVIHFGDLMI